MNGNTLSQNRCKAKNPAVCPYHGDGAGFHAYRELVRLLRDPMLPPAERTVPIKNQTLQQLTCTLVEVVERQNLQEQVIRDAVMFSARVHRQDLRTTATTESGGHKGPYIEHPLRNTVRLTRWGVTDQDLLVASLLHDTVEDHPELIIKEYSRWEVPNDEEAKRKLALIVISKRYNPKVAKIVAGMSNPITPKYMPSEEKNAIYRQHVEEAIQDPMVFLAKLSDFVDNAFSLHHSLNVMSQTSIQKKTAKYLPVAEVMAQSLRTRTDIPLPDNAILALQRIVDEGRDRLASLYTSSRA